MYRSASFCLALQNIIARLVAWNKSRCAIGTLGNSTVYRGRQAAWRPHSPCHFSDRQAASYPHLIHVVVLHGAGLAPRPSCWAFLLGVHDHVHVGGHPCGYRQEDL